MKEKKSLIPAIIALAVGVLLIIFGGGGFDFGREKEVKTDSKEVCRLEEQLEERITGLISHINGVSDVKCMIVLESLSEQVYAANSQEVRSEGKTEYRSEYIEVGASDSLVPTTTLTAQVRGVAVVCRGGDDPSVKLEITGLLTSLFNIDSTSVYVVGG